MFSLPAKLKYCLQCRVSYIQWIVQDLRNSFPQRMGLTRIRVIDAFVAEEFIRTASTDADYKITSTFSKILYEEFTDKIHALVYPSVAFREGLNFAFSIPAYHSKMKLIENETKIVKITDALGFGIYNYQPTHVLERVNPDDSLKWK